MTQIYLAAALGVAGLAAVGFAGARVVVAARTLRSVVAGAKAQLEPGRARLTGRGDETMPQAAYDRG
ncbi:hypothetical protein AB0M50_31625 [Nonomuraea fuscirosea]|jgi:hypothetical protein|uniref:hypothetical protein n=1 Tax=Nonomuraea fuscirosea TaxID=1291556 RepID=UPI002DD886D8|nr:hypothetical protein [Nonomuraea fuscirosea]WSA55546.1 hypothetical protein OIE67_13375 [Nonomuraea fuscirosea]